MGSAPGGTRHGGELQSCHDGASGAKPPLPVPPSWGWVFRRVTSRATATRTFLSGYQRADHMIRTTLPFLRTYRFSKSYCSEPFMSRPTAPSVAVRVKRLVVSTGKPLRISEPPYNHG